MIELAMGYGRTLCTYHTLILTRGHASAAWVGDFRDFDGATPIRTSCQPSSDFDSLPQPRPVARPA